MFGKLSNQPGLYAICCSIIWIKRLLLPCYLLVNITFPRYRLQLTVSKRQGPLCHHVQFPSQKPFPAGSALALAAGSLRNAACPDKYHSINLQLVLFCHCMADGLNYLIHVQVPVLPLYLLNNHQPLFIKLVHRKGYTAA